MYRTIARCAIFVSVSTVSCFMNFVLCKYFRYNFYGIKANWLHPQYRLCRRSLSSSRSHHEPKSHRGATTIGAASRVSERWVTEVDSGVTRRNSTTDRVLVQLHHGCPGSSVLVQLHDQPGPGPDQSDLAQSSSSVLAQLRDSDLAQFHDGVLA